MKRTSLALRRFFGWLLIILGIIWLFASVFTSMLMLFSPETGMDFGERIASFLLCVLMAVVFFAIAYLGWKLQKKCEAAAQANAAPVQPATPAQPEKTAAPATAKPAQPEKSAAPAAAKPTEPQRPVRPVDPALLDVQKLLIKLHAQEQLHPAEPLDEVLRKELAQKLLSLDQLFLAMDVDFNRNFPFVGNGGRMELFTCSERAELASRGFDDRFGLRFTTKCFNKSDFASMLEMMQFNGFTYLTVENGITPVQLRLSDFEPAPLDLPVVDRSNVDLRYMLIRHLEYGYRLRKLPEKYKNTSTQKELTEIMLTMEANGFQSLADSLLYVFGPGPRQKDVIFYTPKALEKARQLLQENGLGEEKLCAAGTASFQVYDGPRTLRVTNRPGFPAMADSLVCAFTESRSALEVLNAFARYGCDDNLLVITWEDLAAHATECAGVLLDMPTYAFELPKKEFGKVAGYASIPGRIIMSLNNKKQEEQPETPADQPAT